jgi:hypothetical protein
MGHTEWSAASWMPYAWRGLATGFLTPILIIIF